MFRIIGIGCLKVDQFIHNKLNHIRWSLVSDSLNRGRKRILRGGTWIDEDGNLYNCCGKHVGKVEFNEGFGGH